MKITSLQIKNFLGVRAVDVTLKTSITMFAGPNGSGKSSIQEALRMALSCEGTRVPLKKDFASMLTTGQKAGHVEVVGSAARHFFALPKCEIWKPMDNWVAPYVLDASKFASLSLNERRMFLFDLMGLKTDAQSLKALLLKNGHDPHLVEEIAPCLEGGFEAGQKEAQGKAREAKGVWKSISGEAYGSVKAASFRIEKPEVDMTALPLARQKLTEIETELELKTLAMGSFQAKARQANDERLKRDDLTQKAERYAAISSKLAKDEAELREWRQKADAIRPQAEGAPVVEPLMCPACGRLSQLQDGKLVFHVHQPEVADPGARDKLAQYEEAAQLMERCVANDKRDLATADAAARMLDGIDETDPLEKIQQHITELAPMIAALKQSRGQMQATLRALEDAERLALDADRKTQQALALHESIQAWEAIAGSLSPEGIPSQMLGQALGPINERLAYSAHDAGWSVPCIGSEMGIFASMRGGLRPYEMLSESEQWRVDAMIAEAISHISGLKFLALDRFDCLDTQGREDLIYWLDGLADAGEIDTALIFGTLKSKPAAAHLPNTVEAFWIENGVITP